MRCLTHHAMATDYAKNENDILVNIRVDLVEHKDRGVSTVTGRTAGAAQRDAGRRDVYTCACPRAIGAIGT